MIKKIIFFFIGLSLIIALFLYSNGVQRVDVGRSAMIFLSSVSEKMKNYTFYIPEIPKLGSEVPVFELVTLLINLGNGLINLINFIASVVNFILQAVYGLFAIIETLFEFMTNLQNQVPYYPDFPYIPTLPDIPILMVIGA